MLTDQTMESLESSLNGIIECPNAVEAFDAFLWEYVNTLDVDKAMLFVTRECEC